MRCIQRPHFKSSEFCPCVESVLQGTRLRDHNRVSYLNAHRNGVVQIISTHMLSIDCTLLYHHIDLWIMFPLIKGSLWRNDELENSRATLLNIAYHRYDIQSWNNVVLCCMVGIMNMTAVNSFGEKAQSLRVLLNQRILISYVLNGLVWLLGVFLLLQ